MSPIERLAANANMPEGAMSPLVREMLAAIGEDPTREGLLRTPQRAEEAWSFPTSGYTENIEEVVNGAIFHEKCEEIVVVKHIHFYSMCEHHLLPFFGTCSVGYIPNGKVIGLSKIPRIVDVFAHRLQLQERMTLQIAETIQEILEPEGVAVITEAYHLCMMMRGVQKQDAVTSSSAMLGAFLKNPQTRSEFLSLVHSSML
jgi:GTP cyclohydrolase IA